MSDFKIKKKYIYTVLSIIVFKVILELGYNLFVHRLYNYAGFTLEISLIKMVESYLIVIFLSYLLAKLDDYNKPSKVVFFIIYINLYIPISSLYWLQDNSRVYYLVISLSLFILYIILTNVKNVKVSTLKEGSHIVIFVLLGITIFVYGYLILTGGLERFNLNLLTIYQTRETYSESTIPLMGYLLSWQANIINLFFLIYSLIKKNKILISVVLFSQILLFAMTNFRSFLLAPLVVLALYFIMKKGFKNILLLLISSSISLVLIILLSLYLMFGNVTLLSIFLRRLFFVPANLHYLYYEFFEGIDKYRLSHSILSFVFENPYHITPIEKIASEVLKSDTAANVGIFGDAYLNFGLIGILIFIIIFGSILVLFDSVAIKSPLILSMAIIIIPSMSLVNSALFTSLATHGILFAIFVTWLTSTLFRKNERNRLL